MPSPAPSPSRDRATPLLFTPLRIRDLTLENRVVVAPMHQYAAVDGFPTDWHIQNYGRYAAGGFGLVIVESTKVDPRGCGTVGDLGIWDDAFVPALKRIADVITLAGSVPAIQLGHSGRKARTARPWEGGRPLKRSDVPQVSDAWWDRWELVAPSAIPADPASPTPRALTTQEMYDLADMWGHAARRAAQAGFKCVEIHGAHGFFIHETLSPLANHRTDEFGRDRHHFTRLVATRVRQNFPSHLPVFCRLSVDDDAGWSPDDSSRLASELKHLGVDVIDCSGGGMTSRPVSSAPVGYGYQVPYAEKLRRETGIMTMAVGVIVECQQAERILQEGKADLIALAREALYNPTWPMDAARKMGLNGFSTVPPAYGWWLSKRAQVLPSLVTSTAGTGVPPSGGGKGEVEGKVAESGRSGQSGVSDRSRNTKL
ncbi:NADH oxidase family protein [Gonapodya prolifera JEL478]|uniref:NADH oxidase family protein n=1 Tax=Gonapodya prolifera (strain JEL478) TaxID=1344416 RepID=A0A139A073_GONPJ|nr:NADH oxidase family protein [Gonapodya prolifera JEL478]|eukprot:KXS10160.1 NADH oxidase family protein [Gonapodya prolifera JEL478]